MASLGLGCSTQAAIGRPFRDKCGEVCPLKRFTDIVALNSVTALRNGEGMLFFRLHTFHRYRHVQTLTHRDDGVDDRVVSQFEFCFL